MTRQTWYELSIFHDGDSWWTEQLKRCDAGSASCRAWKAFAASSLTSRLVASHLPPALTMGGLSEIALQLMVLMTLIKLPSLVLPDLLGQLYVNKTYDTFSTLRVCAVLLLLLCRREFARCEIEPYGLYALHRLTIITTIDTGK